MLAQDRHRDFGARHHDVLDVFFAHDLVKRLDDFLDVMQVEIVGATLIARLRPSALRSAAGLFADDGLFALGCRAEDKNARLVGVEHHGRVSRVVLNQPGERIQMGDRADEQRVFVDGRLKRDGFEQVGAAGREDRQSLAVPGVILEVLLNSPTSLSKLSRSEDCSAIPLARSLNTFRRN